MALPVPGNPSVLMSLWAPVLEATAEGLELQELGDLLVGRHVIPRCRDYMRSQAVRLLGMVVRDAVGGEENRGS